MAIEQDARLSEAHSSLGVLELERGRIQLALSAFDRAIELAPPRAYEDDDRVRGSGFGSRIDDHTTVDAFDAHDVSRFDATLQLGVIDLLNREPPFVNTDFNFDSRTADARGRRVYANLTVRY